MMRLFYLRFLLDPEQIRLTVSGKSQTVETVSEQGKNLTVSGKSKSVKTLSGQKKNVPGLTVSNQLSWSHYYELLKCNDEMEIGFYQQTAINEKKKVKELLEKK
jgi:hypothetical protein